MPTVVQPDRHLFAEVHRFSALRERLLAQVPDIDAETLTDTLEGLSDIREMIAAVIRSALEDEALADGLKNRMADMKLRLDRLERRAERKRDLAASALIEADIAKLSECDFTASLRTGSPTLEVTAEQAIPDEYWKMQAPKLDRQALLQALKAGVVVEGAALVAGRPLLTVRTK
jgi:hypothetical protein